MCGERAGLVTIALNEGVIVNVLTGEEVSSCYSRRQCRIAMENNYIFEEPSAANEHET
jgi:hypothetical protein